MRKTLIYLLLLAAITGCEKDTQSSIENTDIPLISKLLVGDAIYMEY